MKCRPHTRSAPRKKYGNYVTVPCGPLIPGAPSRPGAPRMPEANQKENKLHSIERRNQKLIRLNFCQSETSSFLRGEELNFELFLWGGGGGINRKDPFFGLREVKSWLLQIKSFLRKNINGASNSTFKLLIHNKLSS